MVPVELRSKRCLVRVIADIYDADVEGVCLLGFEGVTRPFWGAASATFAVLQWTPETLIKYPPEAYKLGIALGEYSLMWEELEVIEVLE